LLLLALVLSGAVLPSPAAEAATPRDFVGVVSEDLIKGDAAYRWDTLRLQAASGVGLLRQTFDWSRIERRRGAYSLAAYDDIVSKAALLDIEVVPILFNPPRFRSSAPRRGARRGVYPPERPGDLGAFAAVLARRYGPRGSLWRSRPDIPRRPIRSWQVWNEPNLPFYWPGGVDAGEYVRLLRATRGAIRRVDRGAETITAGLPQSGVGRPLKRYLEEMYDAGARRAFDTLAVNPYAASVGELRRRLAGVRAVMRREGDGRAPLWVSELGWADRGPRSRFTVGERRQASLITGSFAEAARLQRRMRIRGVVYYGWRDLPVYPGRNFWGLHTGLLKRDGSAKPALAAFEQAVAQLR
jgi:hypothetical protein